MKKVYNALADIFALSNYMIDVQHGCDSERGSISCITFSYTKSNISLLDSHEVIGTVTAHSHLSHHLPKDSVTFRLPVELLLLLIFVYFYYFSLVFRGYPSEKFDGIRKRRLRLHCQEIIINGNRIAFLLKVLPFIH